MHYNNSCVCKKTNYMPPMLNFYNVGRSSCWPCSYMVPRWAGSPMLRKLCSIFFLKNPSRFYNYLFALNEKNVSSFSSVISGCWYD